MAANENSLEKKKHMREDDFIGGEHAKIGEEIDLNNLSLGKEEKPEKKKPVRAVYFTGRERAHIAKEVDFKQIFCAEEDIMCKFNGGEHALTADDIDINSFLGKGKNEVERRRGEERGEEHRMKFTAGEHVRTGQETDLERMSGKEKDKVHAQIKFAAGEHARTGQETNLTNYLSGKEKDKIHALTGTAELAAGEHARTGQGIDLERMSGMGEDKIDGQMHIAKTVNSKQNEQRKLKLPNGVEINFEHIIALAGDHYGIPEHPVIDPSNYRTDEEDSGLDSGRQQRFLDAYNTLARTPKDEIQKELEKLLVALDKEIQTGEIVSNKEWDEITGGYWVGPVPFKFGRMMKLAENNHDHFLPYAREAYLTGHQLAMNKAREASKHRENESKRLALLHEAFSLDAFACHFLTDSFASGHIRVPRVELGKATTLGLDGHLLCMNMHDEDGEYGLRVTNARGDKWIAYGDGKLLEERSKENLKLVKEAVKRSVDQVYEAYCHPNKPLDTAVVTDLIPFVDQEEKNNYPLFQVKDGKLHRRSNINDLQDQKTVSNWWGPTSAVMRFTTYKPKNPAIEAP